MTTVSPRFIIDAAGTHFISAIFVILKKKILKIKLIEIV